MGGVRERQLAEKRRAPSFRDFCVADPNRALFESVVLLAPVLDVRFGDTR